MAHCLSADTARSSSTIHFSSCFQVESLCLPWRSLSWHVFKRLHGREVPGTGLGLAISKRVVERYGGRMWLEWQPGSGSTFHFTLPRAKVRRQADVAAQS